MTSYLIRLFMLILFKKYALLFRTVSNVHDIAIKCKYAHIICITFPINYTFSPKIIRKMNKNT